MQQRPSGNRNRLNTQLKSFWLQVAEVEAVELVHAEAVAELVVTLTHLCKSQMRANTALSSVPGGLVLQTMRRCPALEMEQTQHCQTLALQPLQP
jgi:hypothetical protein